MTQIAPCSAPASTVIGSENDDAFFGPIASWFVLINEIGSKMKPIPNTEIVYLQEYKYIDVTTLTFRCIKFRLAIGFTRRREQSFAP